MSNKELEKIKKIFGERTPGAAGKHRCYSVLVPLVEKDGKLHLLYEVRAAHMKRQPGEICFPGGGIEGAETPKECAVRETMEELGLQPGDIEVLAQMDTVYTYSNFTMYCFLGTVSYDGLRMAVSNPDEVGETFLVPLEVVRKTPPTVYNFKVMPEVTDNFPYDKIGCKDGYNWRWGISEVPIYEFGDRAVWGLTGRITRNFVGVLNRRGGIG